MLQEIRNVHQVPGEPRRRWSFSHEQFPAPSRELPPFVVEFVSARLREHPDYREGA